MPTTFRADTVTGIYNLLVTFAAANPTLLNRAYRARPSGLVDFPSAWVEIQGERVTHDPGQIRWRALQPSVVIVRDAGDNAEDALALDQLVDALMTTFSTHPQFVTGTMSSDFTVGDEEVRIGDYLFPATRFTFPTVTEGKGVTADPI